MTDKTRLRLLSLALAPLLITAVLFSAARAEESAPVLFPSARAEESAPVFFGAWEQDGDEANGPEPIRWRVLDRAEGRALLLSECGLTAHTYHDRWREVTWAVCDLRAWLNGEFLEAAFSETERRALCPTVLSNPAKPTYKTAGGEDTEDLVFLLSFEEVSRYLPEAADRAADASPAAAASGVRVKPNGHCSWWLRTPGRRQYHAACVTTSGDYYDFFDVTCRTNAVRPAVWVDEGLLP